MRTGKGYFLKVLKETSCQFSPKLFHLCSDLVTDRTSLKFVPEMFCRKPNSEKNCVFSGKHLIILKICLRNWKLTFWDVDAGRVDQFELNFFQSN